MYKKLIRIFFVLLFLIGGALPTSIANAAKNFNIKNNTTPIFYAEGSSGNIGVGTTTLSALLTVGTTPPGTISGALPTAAIKGNLVVDGIIYGNGSQLTGLSGLGWTTSSGNVYLTTSSDNVGIGTTSPREKLEVVGNIKLSGVIQQNSGDLAEKMALSRIALTGELRPEPGDVVSIGFDGGVRKASGASSTMVVGIVSTSPAHLLKDNLNDAVAIALSGVVPCKVSDQNGLVRPGDLLVSSDRPGYAMKAPADPLPGSVIGKALQAQKKPQDLIDIVVMLR
jgi:hypothetical protein